MQNFRSILPFLVLLAVALPVVVWLYPDADPYAGIATRVNADGAAEQARRHLDSLHVDLSGLTVSEDLSFNKNLIRQAQDVFGLAKSNRELHSVIPAYYWSVRWKKEKPISFSMGDENSADDRDQASERIRGDVSVHLTMAGDLLEFNRRIQDSARIPSLTLVEARNLAANVLRRTHPFRSTIVLDSVVSERTITQPHRSDYVFVWAAPMPDLPNIAQVKAIVAGNVLSSIETDFKVPPVYSRFTFETLVEILGIVLISIMIIAMVVIAFRRFRSFEIGFRLAIVLAIATAAVVALEILSSVPTVGWELLLSLIFGPALVGGGLLLVWAVSESIGREVWKEKFISLDLLTKGHFAHSRVGAGMVRGMALGIAGVAVFYLVLFGASPWFNVGLIFDESTIRIFGVSVPFLTILTHNLYSNIYIFALFVVFAVSVLRRRIDSSIIICSAAAIVMGLVRQGDISPLLVGIIAQTAIAAIAVWTFYRYDLLSSFVVMYTSSATREVMAMMEAGHPSYVTSGVIIMVLGGIVLLGSIVVQFRKKEITDFEEITPAFVRHITERQRLQQELEIAREVQMSFLPKSDPVVKGLDIASRCVPALEVGGDYYDFVLFGPQKVGIAIGDVSGKGTQAAFYMTLAKGFLRALSQSKDSVSEVLRKINALFYQNVERGAFLSMVYAVFDTAKKSVTLTRAGHNPVLVWKAKEQRLDVIQPNGLALGLENGKQFSKTIEEVRIPLAKGDCFVFYTDGFTEAMNKKDEEYGDDHFAETVKSHINGSSQAMVDGILRDLAVFIGKAKQHDDMTIVVVKVV